MSPFWSGIVYPARAFAGTQQPMERPWTFGSGPMEDRFHEQLLLRADSHEIIRLVQQKVAQIRRRPCTMNWYAVDGRLVHAAQTAEFRIGETTIPALLIAYSLDYRNRVIDLLHVVPVSEVALHPMQPEGPVREYHERPEPVTFERLMQRVYALVEQWRAH